MAKPKQKAYVALTPLSIVIYDESGEKIYEEPFSYNSLEELASLLYGELSNQQTEYDKRIIEGFANTYTLIYSWEKEGFAFEYPNIATKLISENLHDLIKPYLSNQNLKEFLLSIGKAYLEEKASKSFTKDKLVVLLYDTVEGYEKIINESVIRLKELVVYQYPGVYEQYDNNEEFVRDLAKGELKHKPLMKGIDYGENINTVIQNIAKATYELIEQKNKLIVQIESIVKEIMPNVSYLIGAKLASKLLVEAGSLEKLAKLPSSTIQVIGAEKALFLHLRGKGKSPKHGILFLSEYIQKTPQNKRGKVARVLALKLSLAAKIDYFDKGEKFVGEQLKKEMEEFMKKL